jgi:hypothetical protein
MPWGVTIAALAAAAATGVLHPSAVFGKGAAKAGLPPVLVCGDSCYIQGSCKAVLQPR